MSEKITKTPLLALNLVIAIILGWGGVAISRFYHLGQFLTILVFLGASFLISAISIGNNYWFSQINDEKKMTKEDALYGGLGFWIFAFIQIGRAHV